MPGQTAITVDKYPDDFTLRSMPVVAAQHMPLFVTDRDMVFDGGGFRYSAAVGGAALATLKWVPSGTAASAAGTAISNPGNANTTVDTNTALTALTGANIIPAGSLVVMSLSAAVGSLAGVVFNGRFQSRKQ